jgi:hypothetical protein
MTYISYKERNTTWKCSLDLTFTKGFFSIIEPIDIKWIMIFSSFASCDASMDEGWETWERDCDASMDEGWDLRTSFFFEIPIMIRSIRYRSIRSLHDFFVMLPWMKAETWERAFFRKWFDRESATSTALYVHCMTLATEETSIKKQESPN